MIVVITKLIIERPIESKIDNISLPRIAWRGHVTLFCDELYQIIVLKEYPALFDPRVKKYVDQWK